MINDGNLGAHFEDGDIKNKLKKEEIICDQILKKKQIEKNCEEVNREIQFINSLKDKLKIKINR